MISITKIVRYGVSITQEKSKTCEFLGTQIECSIFHVMCIWVKIINKLYKQSILGHIKARNKGIICEMIRNEIQIKRTMLIKTSLRRKGFIKEEWIIFGYSERFWKV